MNAQEVNERFVNNLKRLMNSRHFSQSSFAVELGVSRSIVNRMLSGKYFPNSSTISSLCEAFGDDVAEFFKACGTVELKPNGRKK